MNPITFKVDYLNESGTVGKATDIEKILYNISQLSEANRNQIEEVLTNHETDPVLFQIAPYNFNCILEINKTKTEGQMAFIAAPSDNLQNMRSFVFDSDLFPSEKLLNTYKHLPVEYSPQWPELAILSLD
ncbi:hypothetical protein [Filimonas effusa]|uniref:Uncharacterized protein n=1 Tax=Filimonas effusa TaxID=2508721 RepID=A0A4Q1DA51_9BACT|nr:hypothetical protein [Filimonas effusa]RXK86247.1 hypothetical protein ESB13_05415 [Filimonas effusa]